MLKSLPSCRRTFFVPAFVFILGQLLIAVAGSAQVANSTVTGRVTDGAGAIVVEADVVVTKVDTAIAVRAKTNGDGLYAVPSLGTGDYTVEISRAGFKNALSKLTLTVGQTAQVDVELTIGGTGETVEVQTDSSAQLHTQESTLSYTVGNQQVSDLPLNGRNPYGLAALSPGVIPGSNFGAGISTTRGAVVAAATNNFQSNGGIGGSNEILLDGLSIVVCCQGQPPLTPSVEVVDQFKVLTSAPPAQYGRSSGGILNIVTKTGGNRLHGDIFEFFRNDQLDAANYFTKRTGVYPIPTRQDFRLPRRFNQFGGFVSGPILREKTFFTGGYEGQRNSNSTFVTTTVPTALMRQGIFTEAPKDIYDPYTVVTAGGTTTRQILPPGSRNGTAYPAGRIVSSINPVATAVLALIPGPTSSGIANNYSYSRGQNDVADQYNFRIDHNFSVSQRTFIRGTRDTNTHHENDLFNQASGPNGINQFLTAYLFMLGHNWTVSPSVLVQLNYGFAYQKNSQVPQNFGVNATNFAFSNTFASQQQVAGLPVLTFSSLQQIGAQANANYFVHYTHFLGGSAILQRGNHSLTFGYDGRYVLENQQTLTNPLGTLAFDTTLTNGPTPSQAVPTNQSQFDSFAAFLLGAPTTSSIQRQATVAFTQPYNAVYAQDDWRIRPSLTLNLGLRYDLEMGFRERYGRFADFDPSITNPLSATTGLNFTGGAQFIGAQANPGRLWKTQYNELAPRLGFAWSPNSATVIRGGGGLLFLPTSQRGFQSGTIGYSQTTTVSTTLNTTPANSSGNPFPAGVSLPVGASAGAAAGAGTTISSLIYDTPVSYQEQWNLGIEQQITNKLILTLNYAGGHGVHLPINGRPNDLNPALFGAPGDATQVAYLQANVANPFAGKITTGSLAAANVQRVQLLSAFPQYIPNTGMANSSVIYSYQGAGSASFNGMQAGLQYRGANGSSGAIFYTWSKLLGDVSDITNGFLNPTGNPAFQNYYLRQKYERSVLATDVPHRVVGNIVYTLPFGRHQKFGSSLPKFVDEIVGGWKLNLIAAVQSGFAVGVTQTGGALFSGGRPTFVPGLRPQTIGSSRVRLGGAGQTQNYYNPAAFRLSRSFELGDVPRSASQLRGPVFFQNDLSAIKDFAIHEAIRLQFRLEAFNVLNRAAFGLPNGVFGSSAFGTITTQVNTPRNVQAALKLYF